jgi:hypothetical protein
MRLRRIFLLAPCALMLAGGGPTGPSPNAYNKPIIATPPVDANTGPTMSESGPAPAAFDRYGQANYDATGTYIGGHGIGTQVDNPDQTGSFGIPKSDMPDLSSLHCTSQTAADAGSLSCN